MASDLGVVRGSFARAHAHESSLTGRRWDLGHGEMFMWSITRNENVAQTYLERQKGLPVTVGIGGGGCDLAAKPDMDALTVNIEKQRH